MARSGWSGAGPRRCWVSSSRRAARASAILPSPSLVASASSTVDSVRGLLTGWPVCTRVNCRVGPVISSILTGRSVIRTQWSIS